MTDIFLSYKREDQHRVAPLAERLTKAGFNVWWDRHIEGGSSWRQSIIESLNAAKCVIVVWSEVSVSAAGEFVHDEAGRAKARGVLLPVKIDSVDPPVGFGEIQALNLVGWNGSAGDARFKDVVDAARAIVTGGPRPRPKAPGRRLRVAAFATAAFTLVAGVASFVGDVAGLQAPICSIPGVYGMCAQNGWGGIATPREQAAWDDRVAGDCEGLRVFVAQFPNGAYADEAARRLQARTTAIEDQWTSEQRRLPLTVRTALTGSANEGAARADALTRSSEDLELICGSYRNRDGFRLIGASAEPQRWRCSSVGGGVSCGFDGQAMCALEIRASVEREVCP